MKASIFSVDRTIIWGFSLLASLFVVDGELDCTVCDGLSGYERMNDPNLPEPEMLIRGRIIGRTIGLTVNYLHDLFESQSM